MDPALNGGQIRVLKPILKKLSASLKITIQEILLKHVQDLPLSFSLLPKFNNLVRIMCNAD